MCAVRTNHKYYRLLLPDFVTGKLDGDHREELAAHLASCDECARSLDELKDLAVMLRGVRPADPPTHYFNTVLPRLRERIAGKVDRKEDPLIARFLAPLGALAIIIAVLLQVPLKREADLRAVLDGLESDELAEVAIEQPEYQSLYLIPSTESLASALPDGAISRKLAVTILTDNDDEALLSMTDLTDDEVKVILERMGERKIL